LALSQRFGMAEEDGFVTKGLTWIFG